MNRRSFLALSAAFAASPSLARGAPETIRYATSPGVEPNLQSLDLYSPPGARGLSLLAFIHGGGWRRGDKSNRPHGIAKARYFNAQGFVFASLNYRLSPAVMHPAHIEDTAAALAWLHDNATRAGADPAKLFVMGHSAGAHLAALAATDDRRLGAKGKPLSILKGAILLDGAGYDMARRSESDFLGMISNAFGTDPQGLADASPISHVAKGKGIPPFLIVHTDRRQAVTQSQALSNKLQSAGVEATLFNATGYSHADVNRRFGETGEAVTAATMATLKRWGT